MEPNQNVTGTPSVNVNTPTPNNLPNIENVPEPPKENLMAAEAKEKKGSKGMLIGLILCLLLAAGGVGFGVWAMIDGNTTKDNLNAQINSLKSQNSELLDQVTELNEKITELESSTILEETDTITENDVNIDTNIKEENNGTEIDTVINTNPEAGNR